MRKKRFRMTFIYKVKYRSSEHPLIVQMYRDIFFPEGADVRVKSSISVNVTL